MFLKKLRQNSDSFVVNEVGEFQTGVFRSLYVLFNDKLKGDGSKNKAGKVWRSCDDSNVDILDPIKRIQSFNTIGV